MRCELCNAETEQGQYHAELFVPICSECQDRIGPDDWDHDDIAAELDRDRAADEVERHGQS